MRIRFVSLVLLLATPLLLIAAAQQSTPIPAAQLLQRALAVLSGNQALTDVITVGMVRSVAGGDEESGTFTFKAIASGGSRLDLSLPSSSRTEICSSSANGVVGTWSGTDGISHDISQHNLWSEFSLLPTFTINSLLANNYSISFVANDTVEGKTAEHLLAVRQFQAQGALFNWSAAALQRLTAMDVYLDSSTFLPAAVRFNSHPDHNDLIDIPIEARFSDYRQVGGALVPFHIQKYLNNVLALDFQVSTATFNTRLTTTALTVN